MSVPRRLLAAVSLTALPLIAAPIALATPASAGACQPGAYSASASADLVRVGLLDLRPVGLPVGPVADITIASTTARFGAKQQVKAAATARYADASLLGLKLPTGPLGKSVAQQAPPVHANPTVADAGSAQLGVAKVGSGAISAYATWPEGMACTVGGPASISKASVADLAVLPGSGTSGLVRAPANLTSQTVTGLRTVNGALATSAAAEIELADLRLLSGALKVSVLKPPTLAVTATGNARTSSVDYHAPVLEISGGGVPTQRLDSPSEHLDLAVPPTTLTQLGAAERARTEGLPLCPGDPLGSLLSGLPLSSLTGLTGTATDLLNGTLGGLLGGVTEVGGVQTPSPGAIAVLRLSIGTLEKSISDGGVRARAASLRLQLVVLQSGSRQESAVLDLGIGLLAAEAAAPSATVTGGSPSPGTSASPGGPGSSPSAPPAASPSTTPAGCGGPGCALPVTGSAIVYIVGAGVVLAFLGRLLMLLARRRTAL